MNDRVKEVWRKCTKIFLDIISHFSATDPAAAPLVDSTSVEPFISPTFGSKVKEKWRLVSRRWRNKNYKLVSSDQIIRVGNQRKWTKTSKRWREKIHKLVSAEESRIARVGNLMYVNDTEFCIANGSDGSRTFLGLRYDGKEVLIKRMAKTNNNYQLLKHEEGFLRLPGLDDSSIVRYVDSEEDENFAYLALQLHEYTLEEYFRKTTDDLAIWKTIYQVLQSLRVLHHHTPPILHGDVKMENVCIDNNGKIRLTNFTNSKFLVSGQNNWIDAGTRCWMKEFLKDENEIKHKLSTEIQEAGMLFFDIYKCMDNIYKKHTTLDDIGDILAKDLIEQMINEKQQCGTTVEDCLNHPYFWSEERRILYLTKVGNHKEVSKYHDADLKLLTLFESYAEDGSLFKQWKDQVSPELIQKMEGKKSYAENPFGLLRCIRNMHEHHPKDAAEFDVSKTFPHLLGCTYKLAKNEGWNSESPLKEFFQRENVITNLIMPSTSMEENLGVPVQESKTIGNLK